jgi:hypothetical protein
MFLGVPALFGTCRARSTVTVEDVSLRGGRCVAILRLNRTAALISISFKSPNSQRQVCGVEVLGWEPWDGLGWGRSRPQTESIDQHRPAFKL